MFGYVRVNAQELRVREYECYRALYCGLCKNMGKCTGQCSRLSLSYDFVFLAAVRMKLSGEVVKAEKIRCLLHPFKKKQAVLKSDALAYCAHASALLSYHKLRDDQADEKGFKKLRAILARPLFCRAYKKAKKKYPSLDQKIAEELSALSAIEQDSSAPPSADAPAACFGRLMEAVFCEGLEGTDARIAGTIGRYVGHWIYLTDAADDYPEDCKKNRFNPYRRIFDAEPTEADWKGIQNALTLTLEKAEQAYLLIDRHPQSEINEILDNLFYLGMPSAVEKLILRNSAQKEQQTMKGM